MCMRLFVLSLVVLFTQEAFSYLATKSYHDGMKLFRLRPKVHFQQHLLEIMAAGPAGFNVLSPLSA